MLRPFYVLLCSQVRYREGLAGDDCDLPSLLCPTVVKY